jgi:hypothetical protein
MTDDIKRASLPDRWDGKEREFGRVVLPEPGPKVGVHWGHLLMLEKYLRDIQFELSTALKAEQAIDSDLGFTAANVRDLAAWLELQTRGMRTGVYPAEEKANSDAIIPVWPNEPDVPF